MAQIRAEARKARKESENCSDQDDEDENEDESEEEAEVVADGDDDVFVDFGKMKRTNSHKRRPSGVQPTPGPTGGIAGAMAMAANSMAAKV